MKKEHIRAIHADSLLSSLANQIAEIVLILDEKFNIFLINKSAENLFLCLNESLAATPFGQFCSDRKIDSKLIRYIQQQKQTNSTQVIRYNQRILEWKVEILSLNQSTYYLLQTTNYANKAILNLDTVDKKIPRKDVTKPTKAEVFNNLISEFLEEPKPTSDFPAKHSANIDLPTKETDLFQLEQFPLLDVQKGISNLGTLKLLKELLELMIYKALPEDLRQLQTEYQENNWDQIGKIAHKIKSGALYCGTIRLKYACQYLEHYQKAGYTQLLIQLYLQLNSITKQTNTFIQQWLNK